MFSNPPDLQYQKIIDIKHPAEVKLQQRTHPASVAEFFQSYFDLFLKSVKNRVEDLKILKY